MPVITASTPVAPSATVSALDTRVGSIEAQAAAQAPVMRQENAYAGGLANGDRILVGPVPTGVLSGFANQVATVVNNTIPTFTFAAPVLGQAVFVLGPTLEHGNGITLVYNGADWEPVQSAFVANLTTNDDKVGLAASQGPALVAMIAAPKWDAAVAYVPGDLITAAGEVYNVALATTAGEHPTTAPTKFARITHPDLATLKGERDLLLPVLSATTTAPPVAPAVGDRYIVPVGATGAWLPYGAGVIVEWLGSGWGNYGAPTGSRIHVIDAKHDLVRVPASPAGWERDGADLAKATAANLSLVPAGANVLPLFHPTTGEPAGKVAVSSLLSAGAGWLDTTNNMTLAVGGKYILQAGHTVTMPVAASGDAIQIAPANGDWPTLGATINGAVGWTVGAGQAVIPATADVANFLANAIALNWVVAVGGSSSPTVIPSISTLSPSLATIASATPIGAVGSAIPFTMQFGNIPIASSTITLAAGKTYKLTASIARVNGTAGSGEFTYQFRDTTSGADLGSPGTATLNTALAGGGIAQALVTPVAPIQVQLHVKKAVNVTTIEGNSGTNGGSVIVEEMPSGTIVAQSSVAVSDNAASGYFDIGTMRIQWGQITNTLDGAETFVLPAAFANANYALTIQRSGANILIPIGVAAKTPTTFDLNREDSINGSEVMDFFAIGLKP